MFSKENRGHTLSGILFVALFSLAATYISDIPFVQAIQLSPLIIGIVIGVFYANTLRNHLPEAWVPGILFCTKTVLRWGIILYGFRLTFQALQSVGMGGLILGIMMVSTTFIIGYFIGVKWLKMDRDTTILISAGSSICGAAAVLATEPVIKAKPYKSVIAVSTVVVFGTISMFLFPFAYSSGWLPFNDTEIGLFIGGTIHEVAHAVAAGSAINPEVTEVSVISKMIRVMLLAPFLITLSIWIAKTAKNKMVATTKSKITIPWFAFLFIGMIAVNSLQIIPSSVVVNINEIDTFLLTMAMTALGMETNLKKFKSAGTKPIALASILYAWLIGFGIIAVKLIA